MSRVGSFLIACLLAGSIPSLAQDVDYTQYYLNNPGTNAGFTGIEDYADTRLAFRQGWNNFSVKNNFVFFSMYGSLSRTRNAILNSNSLRISDQDFLSQMASSKGLRRKHGLGGMVSSRQLGPYAMVDASANYAYHIPITKTLSLSLGTQLSFRNERIDLEGYVVRDDVNDAFYQEIMRKGQSNQNFFHTDFGLLLYGNKFIVGLSSKNLVRTKLGEALLTQTSQPSIILQSGLTSAPLAENFKLSSGFRIVYTPGYDLGVNVHGRLLFNNVVYAGAGYSTIGPKMSLLFGLRLESGFSLNYSYDRYLNEQNNFNFTSHELMIGLVLFNRFGIEPKLW